MYYVMKRFTEREAGAGLHYLCLRAEINEGGSKAFSIYDNNNLNQQVALFNIEGNFYAISNICAHEGGPLNQGTLEKTIVTCPWHGWKYDVRNGKSPHLGGDSVKSFKIKLIGNKLYLDLTN
jgi:nitrite reductase/ring-hydroxylating ferredoxin subunit